MWRLIFKAFKLSIDDVYDIGNTTPEQQIDLVLKFFNNELPYSYLKQKVNNSK